MTEREFENDLLAMRSLQDGADRMLRENNGIDCLIPVRAGEPPTLSRIEFALRLKEGAVKEAVELRRRFGKLDLTA